MAAVKAQMEKEQAYNEAEAIELAEQNMDTFIEEVKKGEQVWPFLPKVNTYLPKDIAPFLAALVDEHRLLDEYITQVQHAIQQLTEEHKRAVEYQAILDEKAKKRRMKMKDADYDYENDRDNALSDEA